MSDVAQMAACILRGWLRLLGLVGGSVGSTLVSVVLLNSWVHGRRGRISTVTSKADIRLRTLMHWASAVVLIVGLKVRSHRLTPETLRSRSRQVVLVNLRTTVAIVMLINARVDRTMSEWLGASASLDRSLRETRSLEWRELAFLRLHGAHIIAAVSLLRWSTILETILCRRSRLAHTTVARVVVRLHITNAQ